MPRTIFSYAVIASLRRSKPGQSETAPVSICKIDNFQSIFLFKSIYLVGFPGYAALHPRLLRRRLVMTAVGVVVVSNPGLLVNFSHIKYKIKTKENPSSNFKFKSLLYTHLTHNNHCKLKFPT